MQSPMFKVYVLNLPSASRRLKLISELLSFLNLDYRVIAAVDGREWLEQTKITPFSKILYKKLSPGEVGCFLSHRKAWEIISKGEEKFGLVLEDDAVFGEKLKQFLLSLEKKELSFDVLHFEYVGKRDSSFITTLTSEKKISGVTIFRLLSPAISTGALVISRKGAEKLLSLTSSMIEPADEILFNIYSPLYGELEIYQTSEILAWQSYQLDSEIREAVPSTIKKGKVNRKSLGALFHGLNKLLLKGFYLLNLSLLKDKKTVTMTKNEKEREELARLYLKYIKKVGTYES